MAGMNDDRRPYELFQHVESGREREWVPVNQQERDVVSHADIIREFVTPSRREGIGRSIRGCGWSMGMEILRFISHRHDDEETAYRIATLSGAYDNDMMTKVLDDVYGRCINNRMPPEWVIPEVMNKKDDGQGHTFVINPKGLKI